MRQWHVNPRQLCRKHLLGEHLEHHMAIGALTKGRSIAGFVRDGLIEPLTLISRHNDIAGEMELRGYNHKSDIIDSISNNQLLMEAVERYGIGSINRPANIVELARRCEDCRALLQSTLDHGYDGTDSTPK